MVSNRTALRLPQVTIDRLRRLARSRSETAPDRDIPWSVIGRELLERALATEERQTGQASASH